MRAHYPSFGERSDIELELCGPLGNSKKTIGSVAYEISEFK